MSESPPVQFNDVFSEEIKRWEVDANTSFETRFAEIRAAASTFIVANRIVSNADSLSSEFDKHLRSCIRVYIYNKYYSVPALLKSKQNHKHTLKQLITIQSALDEINEDFSYLWGQIARNSNGGLEDIFSDSFRHSVDEAVNYFKHTAASRSGPRSRFFIEFAVEKAIEAFEAGASRSFKRNFKISEPLDQPTAGFETADAAFVYLVLHTLDPSLTLSNVRTAFLKLAPKKNMEIDD